MNTKKILSRQQWPAQPQTDSEAECRCNNIFWYCLVLCHYFFVQISSKIFWDSSWQTERAAKGHLFCKQCLHGLQFNKTRYSLPNLSKLARADISCQFKKRRYLCRLRHCLVTKRMDFSMYELFSNETSFCPMHRDGI